MKKILAFILSVLIAGTAAGAVFASPEGTVGTFSDVEPERWSAAAIRDASEKGYMLGTGDGKFSPDAPLTRAEAVTVLWRRLGSPAAAGEFGFTDVTPDNWYSDAVFWAKEAGVVFGVSDSVFDPDGPVTREALAAIFRRYSAPIAEGADAADLSGYPDAASVSGWAEEALAWSVGAGLVIGVDGGTLDPKGTATREQFAEMIGRYDEFAENVTSPVAADFYVAEYGSDSWDGSFARPFRTVGRAALAVRGIEKTADRGGITVAVRSGEYVLFDFDLSSHDSGTEDCPVTYKAYGDGPVVITDRFETEQDAFSDLDPGETELFGKAADHVKKADVSDRFPVMADPTSYTLTGEDGELWLARYPNKYSDGSDFYLEGSADTSGATTLAIKTSLLGRRIAKYRSLKGVMLCGDICYAGIRDYVEIGSYDADAKTLTVADPTALRSYPWFGGFRYVTFEDGTVDESKTNIRIDTFIVNAPEELDGAGEFYVDAESGTLYVYDPSGSYVFEGKKTDPNFEAEYVTFEDILFTEKVYDMPVFYLDKEGDGGFKVLNLSDPQLFDNEWDNDAGRILTETVNALVEAERPDLITLSGDLAWSRNYVSYQNLADLLESTGVPWAPVLGNHDEAAYDAKAQMVDIFTSHAGCIFDWGDERLGCGNYVIVLRQNGVPIHAMIMMDTHSNVSYINEDGEYVMCYAEFTEEQIVWYRRVCEKMEEIGVPETSLVCHIPCYAYKYAFEAALLPEIDPKSVPAGDGMQVGVWAPGYEDSFGVMHEDGIASCMRDNDFFSVVLECGSTKTLVCGHDHINNFVVKYLGVNFVYSLKTGPGCYWEPEMNGGTAIDISPDGAASVRHHYIEP